MLSRVTAKNVGDVFLRHTVELVNACVDMELIICIPGPAFYRSCIFQPCIFSPAFSAPPLQIDAAENGDVKNAWHLQLHRVTWTEPAENV